MQRRIKILIVICMLPLIFSACGKENIGEKKVISKSIEFYKYYDKNTGALSNKSDVLPVDTEVYAQIINVDPFNTDNINITIYAENNGVKNIIGGANKKVDPYSTGTVMPFTLNTQGEYHMDVYTDKPENVLVSGTFKIGPK